MCILQEHNCDKKLLFFIIEALYIEVTEDIAMIANRFLYDGMINGLGYCEDGELIEHQINILLEILKCLQNF